MAIIIFILVLALLILSHEWGHFLVAKRAGMRVDEFGLGFPPRLWSWRRGETVYSLNLLPLGGFVKIFGEDPDEAAVGQSADRERAFNHRPKLSQAAVLVAGVLANWLLAWLCFSIGLAVGLPVSANQSASAGAPAQLLITSVRATSPAQSAGLVAGDTITALRVKNGAILNELSPATVSEFIARHPNDELALVIKRAHREVALPVTLKPASNLVAGRAAIGITMDEVSLIKLAPLAALARGAGETINLSAATAVGLFGLIGDAFRGLPVLDSITGPVGLAGLVSSASALGWVYLLGFTALISVNLAVLNLLPFPALDGGRLLFLLIEKLKGSPLKPQIANALNTAGFLALLLLMAVVTYGDIRHLLF